MEGDRTDRGQGAMDSRVRRARFPTKTSLSPLRTEVGDTGAMKASVGRIVKRKLGFH